MMVDPEGSPSKQGSFAYAAADTYDDPWYSSSDQSSPQAINSTNGSRAFAYDNASYMTTNTSVGDDEDYENELPLLEELGIRFDHIWSKTQAVMYPHKVMQHLFNQKKLFY